MFTSRRPAHLQAFHQPAASPSSSSGNSSSSGMVGGTSRLWVLNSGLGELQCVDLLTGHREMVIRLPGYTRGLTFHDRFAFVALSTIREKREFGGVPVEQHAHLLCAIHAVDLQTARSAGTLTFESGCSEIFDLQLLRGRRWPHLIGLHKSEINDTFVIP